MVKIEFELLLEGLTEASNELKNFASSSDKQLKGLSKTFQAVGAAALAAFAGFSLKTVIEESLQGEEALLALKTALDASGGASESRVKDFEEFAGSIEQLVGVSDEFVLKQVAFLKQLGATDEQSKKLITTATNLTGALGTDLQGAITQLAASFSGNVSKSLVKLIPELNNLTEAQLRAGGATDLLAAKFPDVAKSLSGSLTVQLKILNEVFGDLLQSVGDFITQNSIFKGAISTSISVITSLTSILNSIRLGTVSQGFKDAAIAVGSFLTAFALVVAVPQVIGFAVAAVQLLSINIGLLSARVGILNALKVAFTGLTASVNLAKIATIAFQATVTLGLTVAIGLLVSSISETKNLADAFTTVGLKAKLFGLNIADLFSKIIPGSKGFKNEIEETEKAIKALKVDPIRELASATKEAGDSAEGLGKKFKKTAQQVLDDFNNLVKQVSKENLSPVGKIQAEQKERIRIVEDALNRGVISTKQAAEAESAIRIDAAQKTFDQVQKLNEISKGILAESIKSPFGGAEIAKLKQQFIDQGASKEDLAKLNVTVQIGQSIGVIQDVFNGAKGAVDSVSKGLGFIADSFLPGIGGAVSSVIGLLAQGPEEVRKNIDAFFTQLPVVIGNVLSSLPEVLIGIVSNLGPLIENLILVAIPGLVTGLLSSIGPILDAIINAILLLPETLATSLPGVIDKLVQDAPRIISELVAKLPEFFSAFAAQLPILAVNFGINLAAQAPFIATNIALEFIRNIPTIAKGVGDGIAKAFQDAIKGITNVAGNVGDKVSGAGKSVKNFLGFAEGGRIPSAPQFANDRGLAIVSSGEQVLSEDLTNRLENFLDSGSRGGATTIILQIGENQLAQVLLDLNQKGFRTA